ncbi:hypothetical protein ABVT39_025696 [Epinephelus coioides]
MDKELNLVTDIQGAQMLSMLIPEQFVRRILLTQRGEEIPELFPNPDYMDDSKDEEEL